MLTQSLLKVMDNTSLSVHRKPKCRRDKHGESYKFFCFNSCVVSKIQISN